jgi:hypothetical protein
MDMQKSPPSWSSREKRQADLFATAAAVSHQNALAEPVSAPGAHEGRNKSANALSEPWIESAQAKAHSKAPRERATPRLTPIDGAETPPRTRRHGRLELARLGLSLEMTPEVAREMARGGLTAMALALPAFGFFFGAPVMAMTLMGISLAALVMLMAIRVDWTGPAWAAAFGAGAWSLAALQTGGEHDALLYSITLSLGGLAGLAQAAFRRRSWSGAAMTLMMAGSALALSAETTLVSTQGAAYGVLVAGAAVIGASRLRRDGLHIAAFAAAGAALMVHSGQSDAAIWFTPLAAWAAAVFLGVTAVRVPALGSRGALLAATGVAASLFAAASLAASHQGLASPLSAAGAYVGLALFFAGVLFLAARRAGGVPQLALTAWIMVAAISLALGAAILIALPLPLAAAAFGLVSLSLVFADRLWRDRVWRWFAVVMSLSAFATVVGVTRLVGASDVVYGPYGQAAFGLALPGALLGLSALFAKDTPNTSGTLETVAIAIGLISLTALTRIVFSGGAPALQPVSLVEAGVHLSLWSGAALALAIRSDRGAGDVRRAYALLLAAAAAAASTIAVGLLLTPYWAERPETALSAATLPGSLFSHAPLGLALPALAAWGHYGYWRWRRAPRRTRLALSVAGFLTASFVTLELALQRPHGIVGADWTLISSGMLAFALAIALQVAPAVTVIEASSRLDLEEYLKRNGRG